MRPPDDSREPLRLPAALRLVRRLEFPRKLGLCERLFGAALARRGIRWVRTAPGPLWKLDLANPTHRWIVYGGYEGAGWWRWVRAHAGELGTIVDSGANIGQTVLYFARLLPQARILAYEPGAAARAWLEESVAANGFGRVQIQSVGLGASPLMARLNPVGGPELHGSWNRVGGEEGEPISVEPLDRELERQGVERLDLWKLDLEGYELEALRGASASLQAGRIGAVYMEVGEEGAPSVAHLRGLGYTPWTVRPSGALRPMEERHDWGNVLFLPPGRGPGDR